MEVFALGQNDQDSVEEGLTCRSPWCLVEGAPRKKTESQREWSMEGAVECLLLQKGAQVNFVGSRSLLLSLSLWPSELRVEGDGDGNSDSGEA